MINTASFQMLNSFEQLNSNPLCVGLIGTGRISDIYLQNLSSFSEVNVKTCGSLNLEESADKAKQYDIANVATPDEIIADNSIDCVLNLTLPAVHAEVSLAALQAGKHVYSEKPLATNLDDSKRILDLASSKGLIVGNAPDTFLGGR